MLEKIFGFIIYLLGAITFSIILVFTVMSTVEKIQIKIKKGKDPKVNIKHINRLIRKIESQGWRVEAFTGQFIFNGKTNKAEQIYKPINEVRLSKTRLTKLGVEVDEENNVIS